MLFLNHYASITTFLIFIIGIKANNPEALGNSDPISNDKKVYFATRILNSKEIKFHYQNINEDLYSILGIDTRYF